MATLLEDIEAFLLRHNMAPSSFGGELGDRHFVRQLRNGRRVWPDTERRVRAKMAEHDHEAASNADHSGSASGKTDDPSSEAGDMPCPFRAEAA
uniref:hypothetical protein n=1 Tax=Edaphosphingomonas laterariae TaxID=861865 RepID=UPI001C532616|nr:hypothetical protein [Sphingomonas laterariae]